MSTRPASVSVVPWWSGRRIPYIARMTRQLQTLAGGPTLPQERRLVTDIPGPRSTELLARKKAAVADGVGTTLPVFVEAAGGGVIVDADGNSLIDLGSGHRGGLGRQRRARGRTQGDRPGGGVHPHLLHGHAVRRLRRGLRGARGADAGRPREEERAVQLRRRGRRERRQDRPRRHRTRRRRRLRPRLPRPHEPDDGDDGQEHAVQERLRAVRLRGLPRPDVLPVPRRTVRRGGRGARDRPPRQAGRRGQPRLRGDRADPGRGRVHRAGAGLPAALARLGGRQRRGVHRRRDPVRASAARAAGSRATTRAWCPTW